MASLRKQSKRRILKQRSFVLVTVHAVLCIHCKVREKVIQVWANPICEANFKWIGESCCEWSEQ